MQQVKWNTTCCTHPHPDELSIDTARSRLQEEIGMDYEPEPCGHIVYRADFEDGLIRHEYDLLFTGLTDEPPSINSLEVSNYRYLGIDDLETAILQNPDQYTVWSSLCLQKLRSQDQL
ncbi:NUDIX domain-containing protein [Mucilaginibacter endophyticus]|uniref:NUDIX domain-containing protein n=1 Tax=Mucilaginibacter endophyticus TaxID=2675003 RepID=UPI003CC560C4